MKKIFSIITLLMVMAASAGGYNLKVGTSEHGTIAFKVNNAAATTADEGATVTVVVTPATGYVLNEISGKWAATVVRTRGSIDVSGDIALTAVSGEENTYTFTMKRADAKISATYKILEEENPVIPVPSVDEKGEVGSASSTFTVDTSQEQKTEERTYLNPETGQIETNTVTVMPITLEKVEVTDQTGGTTTNKKSVGVAVPAESYKNGKLYEVTSIAKDAFKTPEDKKATATTIITTVQLPDTPAPLKLASGALDTDDGSIMTVISPLMHLDDYAMDSSVDPSYKEKKLMATVEAPNNYWTLSCGVDVIVPEGVTIYKCVLNKDKNGIEMVSIMDQLKTVNDKKVIDANNGVLVASTKGNAYNVVAHANSKITSIATDDKKTYGEDNLLVPVIEGYNYPAGQYYILKNNQFHPIKQDTTKTPACKAILHLPEGVTLGTN